MTPPLCHMHHGSSILTDSCSVTAENHAPHGTDDKKITNRCRRQVISFDTLSDEVLLAIFEFFLGEYPDAEDVEAWQLLVHVCRRWRSIVFESPCRLNLRLAGTPKTPVTDMLDVWPDLPLVILDTVSTISVPEDLDNIIALLERSHRVCQILLDVPSLHLEEVLTVMEAPFPELTELRLASYDYDETVDETVPVGPILRDSFLGGSAPRLRSLELTGIPLPSLPKLLLSATHLVDLSLFDPPPSGYISPETLVIALSAMTNLGLLSLRFQSPRSRPDQAHPRLSPPTRSILPVLTLLGFNGLSEYLEDLVARIDAPLLHHFFVTFNQIVFDTTQFTLFIGRTPRLKALRKARVRFGDKTTQVDLKSSGYGVLEVTLTFRRLARQLLSLGQVCTTSLPPLSTSEDLYICEDPYGRLKWRNNVEITPWLELLRPFNAVKNLYLSEHTAPRVILALQEPLVGGTTELLPALQNIFLEELEPLEPIQEAIGQFVAARQVTSHPIAVSRWDPGTYY